jgi:hypothetical protein
MAPWRGRTCSLLCCCPAALLLLLGLARGAAAAGGGGTVTASCPLAAVDCTAELQAALTAPAAHTVVVPAFPRAVWPVLPLFMSNASASNRRVVFESGVTVEAIRGAFKNGDSSLLLCMNIENVTFEGAGATFLMHRADYANHHKYNHSESRMGLELHGVANVTVTGLNISSTGGDGIYISGNGHHVTLSNGTRDFVSVRNESRDITIADVHCHNNYR